MFPVSHPQTVTKGIVPPLGGFEWRIPCCPGSLESPPRRAVENQHGTIGVERLGYGMPEVLSERGKDREVISRKGGDHLLVRHVTAIAYADVRWEPSYLRFTASPLRLVLS